MKKYKTENCNQYYENSTAVCFTNAAWRKSNNVEDKAICKPSLFVGGACGEISRKFAADIIRQFRKDQARERGGK